MPVIHARVDDRVIHGQTTTGWMAKKPADGFLVISDKVASDQLRCRVLKAAAGSFKLGIYTIEQGVRALEKAKASQKRFFVISDSTTAFADLKRRGADFGPVLNVGNLNGTREHTKNMGNAVLLNDDDLQALDYLQESGVDLQFQLLPNDAIKSWNSMRERYIKMHD